jgi:hypothetical protein
MSMWLGPPRIQRMMAEGWRFVEAVEAPASTRSKSARLKPALPSTPAFRKLRRSNRSVLRNSSQPTRVPLWQLMRILLAC